jgi:LysR family glycine cleavage system transcriptional activator
MRSRNVKSLPSGTVAHGIRRSELPPLHLLYTFEAAARTLSFTVAAGELFLTQSAVSRQIQQVEEALGAHLFERRHRALALTEAGQVMQRAVVDCLARLRDATASVRATQPGRQIAITTTPGFASLWLIPRLARFTASHPQVDVRISATLEVLDLQRSAIDVSVRLTTLDKGLGRPLFEEQVLPVCAPQLLQDRSKPLVRPADLAHHTLLAIDTPRGQSLTMDWEPWFKVMGLPEIRMKNTLRFSQYSDVVAAAVAGQGVAIGRIGRVAHAGIADLDDALAAAAKGFETWRNTARHRAQQDHARAAAAAARTRRRHRAPADAGAGQAAGRGQGRGAHRRADIIEWFADEGRASTAASCRRARGPAPDGAQGAGGPGGGVHAVELPDQPGGAQAVRRAGHRLLDHRQGAGGNPGLAGRADPRLCRRRRAAGVLGLVYGDPAEISRLPDPAPGDPQDHLHRLHAGGQAAGRAGRPAHEARDDGARRPRAGDRGRRRRRRAAAEGDAGAKFRNAGQVCISPTRFLVQEASRTTSSPRWSYTQSLKVGDGLEGTTMGPLANPRRITAMQSHAGRGAARRHRGHRRRAHRR